MSEIFDRNRFLKELYLHWNEISGNNTEIFDNLAQNYYLRVLDLSWNRLGIDLKTDDFCQFIKNNIHLRHLDLSNNNFTFPDCEKIAKALKENQSIYGFHFGGNYGYFFYSRRVDHIGFLQLDRNHKSQMPIIERIKGCMPTKLKKNKFYQEIPDYQFCWLCDGWQ